MKQIYYVIQTLLRGRGSNIIKIISLGLSLTMSILLFSRVAYEQSFDTCYKDYAKNRTVVLWQAPYWRIFRNRWKLPPALATGKILPCTMATFVLMKKRLWQTRSFFRQWVSRC